MKDFTSLGLSTNVLKALPEMGIKVPSAIQEQAIPQLLTNDCDFIGLAQTGTGKTAAFGLPLLDVIDTKNRNIQGIVLAPTRELGQQIAVQIQAYSKYMPEVDVQVVYGGAPIQNQIRDLKRKPQIVIATPGRLIDLIKRKAINLAQITHVVLDEADEMLNMGFKEAIDEILTYTPETKFTWLFSATMPSEIRRIVKQYMHEPAEVSIDRSQTTNADITHLYAVVKREHKKESLQRYLDLDENLRGIVFCRTKIDTQNLAADLMKSGYRADALHGDLSQAQRDRVMKRMRQDEFQVLIATDVAARGIDVNNLTHVFHMAIPDMDDYYTHRSGRTGRAGNKGSSIAFVTTGELRKLRSMQKRLKVDIEETNVPDAYKIIDERMMKWAHGVDESEPIPKLDPELLDTIHQVFEHLDKSTLINKLLSIELSKLNQDKDNSSSDSFGGGTEARGGRSERRGGRDDKRGGRDDKRGGRDGKRSEKRDATRGERNDRRDRRDIDKPNSGAEKRLRDRSEKRKDREKGDSRKSSDFETYSVNIGKTDGVSKGELLSFLREETKLDNRDFGDVNVDGNDATFEVNRKHSDVIKNSFDGIFVNKKKLKVSKKR